MKVRNLFGGIVANAGWCGSYLEFDSSNWMYDDGDRYKGFTIRAVQVK